MSHALQRVNREYSYDIHSVKFNMPLLTISGRLAVHGAAGQSLILSSPPLTPSRLGKPNAAI
jgi:hypothetical protein